MLEVHTITRTYETFEDARNVAVRLAEAGIQPERIGLLGQQAGGDTTRLRRQGSEVQPGRRQGLSSDWVRLPSPASGQSLPLAGSCQAR